MQQAKGIGLIDLIPVALRFDVEFIESAVVGAGDEAFPDTGGASFGEAVSFGIPAVEVADNRYRTRIGRPDAEDGLRTLRYGWRRARPFCRKYGNGCPR